MIDPLSCMTMIMDPHSTNNAEIGPDPYRCIPVTRRLLICLLYGTVLFSLWIIALLFLLMAVPAVLIGLVAVPIYYCLSKNPMPFSILMYTLLGAEEFSCRFWTDRDIQTSLIRRRCEGSSRLGVDAEISDADHTRGSKFYISIDQDLEVLSHNVVAFSKPLPRTEILDMEAHIRMSGSLSDDNNVKRPPLESEGEQDRSDDGITERSLNHASCPVCFSSFQEGDIVAWSRRKECTHAFHLTCLNSWIRKSKPTCPVCRLNYKIQWGGKDNRTT